MPENDTNALIVLPPKWAEATKGSTTQSGGCADAKTLRCNEQSMAGVVLCGRSFKNKRNIEMEAQGPEGTAAAPYTPPTAR